MRKRSKKRISQDIKPWVKVTPKVLETFSLPIRQTTRWVSGARRDWETKVLKTASLVEISKTLLSSASMAYSSIKKTSRSALVINRFSYGLRNISKLASLARYKNFCLLLGRGRTYNRALGLSRHSLRKFAGTGYISGLYKC